ncbi:glycosyltransferase family 2 protein [Candidatus Saccharibacteria bacterium CPR2]|nr:glycosyltransferase family 2 protein [Candidatus Saccharibacteria bacterium CPR2]
MHKNSTIAIVIPAYNEGVAIKEVIKKLRETLAKRKLNFEIIVVDDGSKDNTAEQAREAGAHVIQHILNAGTGAATATGLYYAQQNQFDIAATLDADGQHDPEDVITGIKLMLFKEGDLLIGSRLINSEGMSKVKILGNKGLSFITYMLFGISVTDSQSGLRIFSRNALDHLKWRTNGFEFCSEMLWRAKQKGMVIKEYPIKAIYTDYSKGKGQNNWNAVNIIKSLIQRRVMELFGE